MLIFFLISATKLFAEDVVFQSALPEEAINPSKLVRPARTGLVLSDILEEGDNRETVGEERKDEVGRESRISSEETDDANSVLSETHSQANSEDEDEDESEGDDIETVGEERKDEDVSETVLKSTFLQEIVRNLDESLATHLEPWWRESTQVKAASHKKQVRFAADDRLPIFDKGGAASGFSEYSKDKITFSLEGLRKDVSDHFLRLIDYGGAMHGFTEKNKVEICCSLARVDGDSPSRYLDMIDYRGSFHTFTELNKLRIAKALIMEEPGSHIYNLFLNLSKREHRGTYTEPVTMFYIARKFSDYNGFSEFSRGLTKIDDIEVLSRIGSAKASLRILYYPEVYRSIYSEVSKIYRELNLQLNPLEINLKLVINRDFLTYLLRIKKTLASLKVSLNIDALLFHDIRLVREIQAIIQILSCPADKLAADPHALARYQAFVLNS